MRLHALQYLRAIAALAVVYSHAVIQVEDYSRFLIEAGSFGVDIFFVISGFIMVYISKPTDTPGQFFINRIRRVVPLYWFFTLLMAVILLVLPQLFKATVFEWDALLMSLAFVPHWSVAREDVVWPLLAPGWSLNFEMYFYLLFALSLALSARYRIAFISTIITLVFLLANFYQLQHSGLQHSVSVLSAAAQFFAETMVFEFIFGMLLAVAYKRGLKMRSSTAYFIMVIGTLWLLLQLPIPRIMEYGIPSLLIVMACLYIKIPHYKWAEVLGDASYALYLSHIFTLGVLRKTLAPLLGDGQLAAILFVAISLVVCTVVSVFIHFFIDNWLLRLERLGLGNTMRRIQTGKA